MGSDSWISIGQIVSGVGAILIFVGFLFGYFWVSSTGSNNQGDLEAFFILTGFGILVVIGGWLAHSILPKYMSRPRPAPMTYPTPGAPQYPPMGTPSQPYSPPPAAAPAAMAAPAPMAAPSPAPPSPATPPVPNCPNCGKPTTYVAQYNRYFCYSCSRYV